MTPPPADPIRPVGPLTGGSYVARTARAEQVARRRRREQRDDEPGAHGQHDASHGDDDEATERPPTPLRDPRAYDDHGRRPDDGDDRPGLLHVDAKA